MFAGLLLAAGCGATQRAAPPVNASPENANVSGNKASGTSSNAPVSLNTAVVVDTGITPDAPTVVYPVRGFNDRLTKKPFGIYITPKNSPVQPERFSGYHAGSDAEIAADEQDVDVPIYSIAAGTVTFVGRISGYGGVTMVRHTVGGETVTALYGHVRLASASVKVGDEIAAGESLAVLGKGYSSETDNERKHLHFALLKGTSSVVKGYVQQQSQLSPWHDPAVWLKDRGAAEPSA